MASFGAGALSSLQPSEHDRINSYLVRLRAIGIKVRPRDRTWSPSTSFQNPDKTENLVGLIKFLSFKNRHGVENTITSLEARYDLRGDTLTIADGEAAFAELRDAVALGLSGRKETVRGPDVTSSEAVISRNDMVKRFRGIFIFLTYLLLIRI
jgi:hypothetical protein